MSAILLKFVLEKFACTSIKNLMARLDVSLLRRET